MRLAPQSPCLLHRKLKAGIVYIHWIDWLDLCITMRDPAWECGFGSLSFMTDGKLELAKNGFPGRSFKAIKLRKPGFASNAKTAIDGAPSPSLASVNPKAKLGLGAPRILKLMDLKRCLGTSETGLHCRDASPRSRVSNPISRVADPINHVADPISRVAEPINRVADPINHVADPINHISDPRSRSAGLHCGGI